MNGGAEAAGLAIFDAMGRRNAKAFGNALPYEVGEEFLKHLHRRGYRLTHDAQLQRDAEAAHMEREVPLDMVPPTRADRVRKHALTVSARIADDMTQQQLPKVVEVNGDTFRCEECGCGLFYEVGTKAGDLVYQCSSCEAKYRGRL